MYQPDGIYDEDYEEKEDVQISLTDTEFSKFKKKLGKKYEKMRGVFWKKDSKQILDCLFIEDNPEKREQLIKNLEKNSWWSKFFNFF